MRWEQGKYTPMNPDKYVGDINDIVFRSSWEKRAFGYVDRNPAVKRWSSETVIVPYISPVDGRPHRYYIDLAIVVAGGEGKPDKIFLIEIKPFSQTKKPRKTAKKKEKTYLNEVKTYTVNQAKWKAAKAFAKKRGWEFVIWTENELYNGTATGYKKPKK